MNKNKNVEQLKYEEIIGKVLESAWTDSSFKERLIDNPIPTIEELLGEKINVKDGMNFVVTDQSDVNTIYFNIPSEIQPDDISLSDEQLEMVAAGGWKGFAIAAAATVLIATGAGAPAGVALLAAAGAGVAGSAIENSL